MRRDHRRNAPTDVSLGESQASDQKRPVAITGRFRLELRTSGRVIFARGRHVWVLANVRFILESDEIVASEYHAVELRRGPRAVVGRRRNEEKDGGQAGVIHMVQVDQKKNRIKRNG